MDTDVKKSYYIQYIHDDDPNIRKSFSVDAKGVMTATAKVEQFIEHNKLHSPEGGRDYTLRIRKLRQRDKVDHVIKEPE